uniref:Uncharacterized protein n=1 Tax=Timema tahoe TaxID=61484 RepID=A0A7R9IL62_9NEOP|nr:unnamed protein product [Timema tahoe]
MPEAFAGKDNIKYALNKITFFALVAVASAAPGLIGAPAISTYAAPGLIGAPATYTATYGVAAPGHLAYAAAPASYGYAASPLAYAAAPASYGYAAAPVAYATGHRIAYSVAPITFFALVAVASAAPGLIGAPAISTYAAPGLIGAPATYTATYGVAAPGHLAYAAAPASYGYAASPLAYAAAPASYGYAAAPVAYATGHRIAYSVAPVEQHGYKIAY